MVVDSTSSSLAVPIRGDLLGIRHLLKDDYFGFGFDYPVSPIDNGVVQEAT